MSVDRSALSALEREKAAVFHSWSAQNAINPLMVKDAKGVYVTDMDDNTYLDFSSQLVNINIGHQHPAVVAAIKAQADLLCTIAPQHGNVARTRAAELVIDHSFEGAQKVFFTNGGTEAVEHAVRMARLHTGRHKVLSRYRSYHGATSTSINLTGDPRRWHHGSAPRIPTRCTRTLRPLRHGLHRRRGDVRIRTHRLVVRLSAARHHAGPRHFRQGRQLGLRPLGRRGDQRGHLPHLRRPGLPRWLDVLRPPAGLRLGGRVHGGHGE